MDACHIMLVLFVIIAEFTCFTFTRFGILHALILILHAKSTSEPSCRSSGLRSFHFKLHMFYFHQGFSSFLKSAASRTRGATIFGYQVKDPERFGVAEVTNAGKVISLEEKPTLPKSNLAVTGLYFYDNDVVNIAKSVKPSARGELEITSINQVYLERGLLHLETLGRGFAWLDTGTYESLLEASCFMETIEKRQGFKVACLEEIAYNKDWIDDATLLQKALSCLKSPYGKYLHSLLKLNG